MQPDSNCDTFFILSIQIIINLYYDVSTQDIVMLYASWRASIFFFSLTQNTGCVEYKY